MDNIDKIKAFCADENDIRQYLHKPFNVGDYVVATNRHIIAWVKSQQKFENDGVSASTIERVKDWIENHEEQSDFFEFDYAALRDKESDELITCRECGGDGYTDCCECGQERECPECDGEGNTETIGKYYILPVSDEAGLQEHYIKIILDIGGMIGKKQENDSYRFYAGEINGKIMKCRV